MRGIFRYMADEGYVERTDCISVRVVWVRLNLGSWWLRSNYEHNSISPNIQRGYLVGTLVEPTYVV